MLLADNRNSTRHKFRKMNFAIKGARTQTASIDKEALAFISHHTTNLIKSIKRSS
jgi:hypothetical protein